MRERANALAISQEEAQHASLLLRVRRATLVVVGPCATNGHYTSRKPLSFSARPWCDVPAAASKNEPLSRGMRKRANALSISQEEIQHARLLFRARRAALVVVGPRAANAHCSSWKPLSSGARPWCDVPAAASKNEPAFAWHMQARHCGRCLSGGGAVREIAACARRAVLVVVGLCPVKGHCTGGKPLSFGARPWCDVSATASKDQPAFAWHARARQCAHYLSGGGSACELAAARAVLR